MESEISKLISRVREGDAGAERALAEAVYQPLRRVAANLMRGERQDHTLQTTALVNEAYMRLFHQKELRWEDRAHFFGAAAGVMRRVLVDHVRAKRAAKRGGARFAVELHEGMVIQDDRLDEVLAVDEALSRLEAESPRFAKVVELRYFVGLSVEETAEALAVSVRTIKRDWSFARAWLIDALKDESQPRT